MTCASWSRGAIRSVADRKAIVLTIPLGLQFMSAPSRREWNWWR